MATVESPLPVATSRPRALALSTRWRRLAGSALFYVLLAIVCLIWAGPLIWALGTAVRAASQPLGKGWLWLPGAPTLENFREAWRSAPFLTYYTNTIIIVVGILACQLVTSVLAGYAFARGRFPGRDLLFLVFIFQLLTPITVLIVPNYLTMRSLHLVNSKLAIMLPYLGSGFGTFLVRQACRTVPIEMEEAARVEGANWWQLIWHVYVPLIRPALFAFTIISATYHWNDFLWPLIVTNTPGARPLTVGLSAFTQAGETGAQFPLIMAGTVLVVAPMLLAFLLLQRQFIDSFLRSGLK